MRVYGFISGSSPSERLRKRMLAGKAPDSMINVPQGPKGKARDQAGKAFGVSGSRVALNAMPCSTTDKRIYSTPRVGGVRVICPCLTISSEPR